jgi:hypothetical protein
MVDSVKFHRSWLVECERTGEQRRQTLQYDSAMPLTDVTRPAVLAAIEEHDRVGREEFLGRYGFGAARDYHLLFNGREYDSKAIAGVAHQDSARRLPVDYCIPTLEFLDYMVSRAAMSSMPSQRFWMRKFSSNVC